MGGGEGAAPPGRRPHLATAPRGGARLGHAADLDPAADQPACELAELTHAHGPLTCATPPGRAPHSHTHCRSRSQLDFKESRCSGPGRASPRNVRSGLSPLPATCSVLQPPAACRRGARGPPRPSAAHRGPHVQAWVLQAACPLGSPSLPAVPVGLTPGLPRLGPFPQHLPRPPAPCPHVDSPRGACPPGSRHLPSLPLPSRSPYPEPPATLAQPPPTTCLILWSLKVPRPCATLSAALGRLSAPFRGPCWTPPPALALSGGLHSVWPWCP